MGLKNVKSLSLTKYYTVNTYYGSEGIAPRILKLGTRCRWVVSFTPRSLYPRGKNSEGPLDMRLGGLRSRSGRCGKKRNWLPPPGIEPRPSIL